MGGASSKAARQLPKTARAPPAWAGARTPHPAEPPAYKPGTAATARPVEASDTRTAAIEQDARDPDFLSKLNQLGPVKVDHHMQTIRPAAVQAKQAYEARLQSELEARSAEPTPNRLVASAMSDLLEDRKYAASPKDIEKIAQRYGVDVAKVESLARYVNAPSVDHASKRRTLNNDGAETTTFKAMWTEPSFSKTP